MTLSTIDPHYWLAS